MHTAAVFRKTYLKRIVGKLFKDQPGIKMFGQQMSQSCFARTDVSFYGNEMVIHHGCSVTLLTASLSGHSINNWFIVLCNTGC